MLSGPVAAAALGSCFWPRLAPGSSFCSCLGLFQFFRPLVWRSGLCPPASAACGALHFGVYVGAGPRYSCLVVGPCVVLQAGCCAPPTGGHSDAPSSFCGAPWRAGVPPASPHVGLASTGVPALTEVPAASLEWIVDFLRSAGGLPGDLVERAAASYSRSLAPSTLG